MICRTCSRAVRLTQTIPGPRGEAIRVEIPVKHLGAAFIDPRTICDVCHQPLGPAGGHGFGGVDLIGDAA